jgi:hypothetical protein
MTYPPVTSLFCEIDDFCIEFEPKYNQNVIALGALTPIFKPRRSKFKVESAVPFYSD